MTAESPDMKTFFGGRRVLVAGATGFIGGAMARRLVALGAEVRATHCRRDPTFSADNLTWMQADLTHAEDCARVCTDMDMVLMCAAATSGAADIVASPLIHLTPNVVMNAQMLEAAYLAKAGRFLFISSATVYSPGDGPMREDRLLDGDPADVYFIAGWMKRYTEILCATYAQRLDPAMPVSVVRPSNVYGPGDKFDWQRSHVTAATIRKAIETPDPITVWGDGETRRDLIYIDDFANAALAACMRPEPYYCVNVGAGSTVTVNEILATALRAADRESANITYDTTRPQTVRVLELDTTKMNKDLGCVPDHSLADGIAETVAWYREVKPETGD